MENTKVKRLFIAGNIAGGKTRLSHFLSKKYNLPVTHVDSIQFLPGMLVRPMDETRARLLEIENREFWIIDGYGPFDMIEKRIEKSDQVIFIDLPLWRHFFWLLKRQLISAFFPRAELPEGCDEFTWEQTRKLFKTLWGMHFQMRPQMLRILNKPEFKNKFFHIQSKKTLIKLSHS